jgi:hypothetical protein
MGEAGFGIVTLGAARDSIVIDGLMIPFPVEGLMIVEASGVCLIGDLPLSYLFLAGLVAVVDGLCLDKSTCIIYEFMI